MKQKKYTEKVLGVLGGMGPAASAEFLRLLAINAGAECDQEHPRVIMISDPHIPDRSTAIVGRGADPSGMIKNDLYRLAELGADVLAVPCNTAHYFIDSFRQALPIPLIHIVEATVNYAERQYPEGSWVLSTAGTRQSMLYQRYAAQKGYRLAYPAPELQEETDKTLRLIKAGNFGQAGQTMRTIVESLRQIEDLAIMTACTELPIAYRFSGLPAEQEVSSLQALSLACLEVLYA